MMIFKADGIGKPAVIALLLCCVFGASQIFAADLQDFTGDPTAPPLALADLKGQQRTLEDYRGKVVMVNFWAGWCHPCIQEIPELIRLAEQLDGRPFEILAVNVGEEKRKLSSFGFVRRMKEHMVILMDTDSKVFEQWKGIGLPSTFVVDPDGQIRYEAYGAVHWNAPYIVAMLEELMEKPAEKADASEAAQP